MTPAAAPTYAAARRLFGLVSRARRAAHRFVAFEIDPFILGVYRAALGLFLLAYYGMLAPSFQLYYGPSGISPWARAEIEPGLFTALLLRIDSHAGIWLLYGLAVIAAACLAAAAITRVAIIILWVMNHSLLYTNVFVANGEEQVLAVLLLLSIFLPLDRSFTLGQLANPTRRRAMFLRSDKVPVWTLSALQLHLVLVYVLGLPAKLEHETWRNGLLVYYAMMQVDYPRWPGLELFAWGNGALSRVLTYITLAAEAIAPFLLWMRRFRAPAVAGLAALHLGLAVFLEGVMMFNIAMVVGLIAFLPSRRTREWIAARVYGRAAVGS